MTGMYARHPIEGVQIPGDDAWPLREVTTWPNNPNTPENNPYRRLKERVYLRGPVWRVTSSAHRYIWRRIVQRRRVLAARVRGRTRLRCKRGKRASGISVSVTTGTSSVAPYCVVFLGCTGSGDGIGHDASRGLPPMPDRTCLLMTSGRFGSSMHSVRHNLILFSGPTARRTRLREIFHASRCGVELRHPYRDRRLVEFMLAIPASQLYRRGRYKYILRNAMCGTLPEQIHMRQEPTSLTPLFLRGLAEKERATVKELLYGPERIWPRYIRADWLALADPGHRRSEAEELVVWLCLCCELWHMSVAH